MNLSVELIPCLNDNYAVLLHDESATVLIDAPEAEPIIARLKDKGWALTHILVTHHHPDHVEGLAALKKLYNPRIFANGADSHRIDPVTDWVKPGGRISVGAFDVEIFDTPGHTVGHVAYYFAEQGLLFAGDALFAGGCGRIFEGNPADFYHALKQLAALPTQTQLYCGHEYTLANLKFGAQEEPDNQALSARLGQVEALRAAGQPTLPSTIGLERETNVFLRAKDADAFAAMRERKNNS